jgi:hypothetical protein
MEAVDMREQEKITAVNVRLRAVEQSDQPIASNFATVTVAQGIAYVDFGFIEPPLLAKTMMDSQHGKTLPEQFDGKLVARISLGLDVLARLQGQMQQVLLTLRQAQMNGKKAEQSLATQTN